MVSITLKSIDVGFDLRVQGMPVIINLDVDEVHTDDGSVSGSPAEIIKQLNDSGFHALLRCSLLLPSVNGCDQVEYDLTWIPGDRAEKFTVARTVNCERSTLDRDGLLSVVFNTNGQPHEWLLDLIDIYNPNELRLRNEICVERTTNGREIRYDRKKDRFIVQPENDNYWIEKKTLGEAQAFSH